MTTKERLHQVVDELSEQEAVDALDYLCLAVAIRSPGASTRPRSMTSR
jgi:hypothetical protein